MKPTSLLTVYLIFRILEEYFFPFGTEIAVHVMNHILPVAIGRIVNLNIQPSRLFWKHLYTSKSVPYIISTALFHDNVP